MKKTVLFLLLVITVLSVNAQHLSDLYKNGAVKLTPDPTFGERNNWNEVFSTYYDTLYGTQVGQRKSLIILTDGSVVVSHAYKNYYSRFSPNGKFEKEFAVKNSNGTSEKKINSIAGVVKNSILFTNLDNMGNMLCFDFNGNLKKKLKLNYMTNQMIALPNNKIAVVGWVIWSDRFREFISLVDYETNAEKVIWEHFTKREEYANTGGSSSMFNYTYKYKKGGIVSVNTMPYTRVTGMSSPPQIAYTNGKLVAGIPSTGEIIIFSPDGQQLDKGKVGWSPSVISAEEQKSIQEEAITRYKSRLEQLRNYRNNIETPEKKDNAVSSKLNEQIASVEYFISAMEADLKKISDPIPIPAFSNIIKDSDGNLLFFEFPKEQNANKFNVWIYNGSGKFTSQSTFVCDEYNIQITPSNFVFHNGYIYGLQTLKNATGVPMRLVRFKLSN